MHIQILKLFPLKTNNQKVTHVLALFVGDNRVFLRRLLWVKFYGKLSNKGEAFAQIWARSLIV